MPPAHPLPLLLTVLLVGHRAAATAGGTVFEVDTLLAFKKSLTIPPAAAGFFDTWDAAAASPCKFTGVTCNSRRSVTGISVQWKGVVAASVPFDVLCSSLASLTTLSLPSNALAGSIDWVGGCTELEELTLAFNSFSGAVPDLSRLTKLSDPVHGI